MLFFFLNYEWKCFPKSIRKVAILDKETVFNVMKLLIKKCDTPYPQEKRNHDPPPNPTQERGMTSALTRGLDPLLRRIYGPIWLWLNLYIGFTKVSTVSSYLLRQKPVKLGTFTFSCDFIIRDFNMNYWIAWELNSMNILYYWKIIIE